MASCSAPRASCWQSLASLERAYDNPTHPNVHETRRALVTLYMRVGKPDLVDCYQVPPGRFVPDDAG